MKNGKGKGKTSLKKKGDTDKLKVPGTRSTFGSQNLGLVDKTGLKRTKNGLSKR
jgi:hypothetical protein